MHAPSSLRRQAGYSLITTLMLTAAATIVLGATLSRSLTNSKLNDRSNKYGVCGAAAEAATEKVLSRMAVDFSNGGEQALSNNINTYRGMVPTPGENPFWTNFQFTDGQGNLSRTYVTRVTTNASLPYVALLTQFPGLNAFSATYRILSDANMVNGTYDAYHLTNAVQQDIQMAEIPVFQFAIFYNNLLEFSDCAPLTVNGRVHCNTNIYVGCLSSSSLTFQYEVTSSGIITNPAWAGFAQSSWTGPITYGGTPAPGWSTGEPVLTLPVGTNNTPAAVREIINPPPVGEGTTNPVSAQRYYNKASLRVELWGTNSLDKYTNIIVGVSTNVYTNTNSISITIKSSMYDPSPVVLSNGPPFSPHLTNWYYYNIDTNFAASGLTNAWLNSVLNFCDQREGRTNHTTQIDVGKLGAWIGNIGGTTNTNCTPKWTGGNPFNGVVYVNDMRFTNGNWMNCVRLTNGVNITNGFYNTGLTVATPNPLYIQGNYNCPNLAYQLSTNTTVSRPCSVACDAITMLSPSWKDSASFNYSTSIPAAANMTANIAIIAGNVPSTDSTSTGYSGGVHNLPRLLESWTSDTLWLNTSMINLYNSVQATKQFQMPGVYYEPPTRKFIFDLNFTTSTGLPPGTPLVDRMIRGTWCNPPPNNVTYAPSPTLLYVPR